MPPPVRSKQRVLSLLDRLSREADPSTAPFLRAAAIGYAAQTFPTVLRIVLAVVLRRKRQSSLKVVRELARALVKGLSPRGLGAAFGVAVGGAKYGERWLEPVVRKVYLAAAEKTRAAREGKGKGREVVLSPEEAQEKLRRDDKVVQTLTTWCSATISSLVAVLLLQSSPGYARRPAPASFQPDPKLDFAVTPYSTTVTGLDPQPAQPVSDSTRNGANLRTSMVVQSPTLDLTLLVFVRAVDTLVRGAYENSGLTDAKGRFGPLVTFLASQADTLVFWLSCTRIMWCWFYKPHLLPSSYSRWILTLARMDPRVLQLLRFAREGRFVYGKRPDDEVARICAAIAAANGQDAKTVNPEYITHIDCTSLVHNTIGAGSCETNAIRRWAAAFFDCLLIYLPVHAIPPLLFNFRRLLSEPGSSILRILLAASRSSAFLATFVSSIYASVCLVRTRLPQVFPSLPQQPLDGGLSVALGCFMCGWSVLIENHRRRREMALYCAPRALYAVLDEIAPEIFTQGKTGELLCRWLERAIFATSAGTVIAATVHRPDLVSGVVKGVVGVAVKDWVQPQGGLPIK
ncbi:hypothetical protein JCM1841_004187 [Sporobolomyces salmonicolor]